MLAAPVDKSGAPEASEPNDADAAPKDEGKPDEAPATDARPRTRLLKAPARSKSGAKMRDILAEGFLIRTTVFIPADAVTRQLGKVSPDAIIVTLQKETAIAVCYYTLKAYVKGSLTDIASCTVFR